MEEKRKKDMKKSIEIAIDAVEKLIYSKKEVEERIKEGLEELRHYISKLPPEERKEYEDRIKRLNNLFYGEEGGDESNCSVCYA